MRRHHAPEPGERFLQRQIIGGRIPVITNYDSAEAQAKVVGRECVMLDIRSDSVPMLPYSTRERAGMSVSVSLPPDAVVELLNYVMEGPEFEDSRFFALRAAAGTGFRTGAHFKDDIYALVRSTQPGTDEQTARLKAGFDASFGLGVSSYAMRGLLAICCGDAAVRGCTEFAKQDVLRLVEASFAHRIQFEDTAPGVKRQARKAKWSQTLYVRKRMKRNFRFMRSCRIPLLRADTGLRAPPTRSSRKGHQSSDPSGSSPAG